MQIQEQPNISNPPPMFAWATFSILIVILLIILICLPNLIAERKIILVKKKCPQTAGFAFLPPGL